MPFVMKRFSIVLMLFGFSCAFSQSAQEIHYQQLVDKAHKLLEQNNYVESANVAGQVLAVIPENLGANIIYSFGQINLKKWDNAKVFLANGFAIDPTHYGLHYCQAYLHAAEGNIDKARESFMLAIQYGPASMNLSEIKTEFETVGKNTGKPDEFSSLFNWFQQTFNSQTQRLNTLDKTREVLSALAANAESVKKETQRMASDFAQQKHNDLALAVFYLGSSLLQTTGYPSEALEVAELGYAHYQKNGFGGNDYQAARLLAHLMDLNIRKFDFDRALTYVDDGRKHFNKYETLLTFDVQILAYAAIAQARSTPSFDKNKNLKPEQIREQARAYATEAYKIATSKKYKLGEAIASNALVVSHDDGKNAAAGINYGQKGLQLARSYNLDIQETIASNLAFCYYGLGTDAGRNQAYQMYRENAETALKNSNWETAATDINNLGTLLMYVENWAQAAPLFEEVVKLEGYGPKYTNYRDRLTLYKRQVTAYQNLIKCYAHLGNAEKTFQAMEASRSRVLLERLGEGSYKKVSLADLQNLLKPDEAVIMYSLTAGHEIIILTVSKKYSQVLYHEDPRFIGDIKDQIWYKDQPVKKVERDLNNLNKFVVSDIGQQVNVARDNYDKIAMAPKSDLDKAYKNVTRFMTNVNSTQVADFVTTLDDLLYRFQKYLIVPVSNRLSGVKNLIIAPDDVFNFIPFEALKTFDKKYLVEKYNIRYVHSASVLMHLQQRNYATSRKPLLAMGGAIYEEMSQEGVRTSSDADMNLLQTEVAENVKSGKSQRKAYATLSGRGPMPYLKGSLDEVKSFPKTISGAEVYTGNDMTENRIKELSKNGQLKNYKVLHMATHGFVIPEIPDLSGIAMSIFKDEQSGEDGFLTSPEIASLKLNADLTVLSACETAQGKFFSGEGVTGITQSLLVAGSNAALVSLWKVNDAATMEFMSNFYKEVAKGKPYSLIVNDLKKRFIKGDFGKEFKHPYFWAPFVYYGN
jgi:CHAT domain-containing protein